MLYNFGARVNGVIQMAYIVEDLHAGIDHWIVNLSVGPWFVLDKFVGGDPVYRGRPSQAEVAIGMAFTGSMLIELIQMNDEHPSVYKEVRDARGFGFHHFGLASSKWDQDSKAYEDLGYELAFTARVPTGDRIAYFDTMGVIPGFIELIEATPTMEAHFSGYYRASLGWDGSDPIRPLI
jgi:hypothetical protein